jgi:hypothetical protein
MARRQLLREFLFPSMEKEQLVFPSAKVALRLRLLFSCWSWPLPSSEEEAIFLLHHYMNIFDYISNMDKRISVKLKNKELV